MKSKNLFNKSYFKDCIAIFAGLLLTFAFAPFSIYPLAIFSPLLFLILLSHTSPRHAFFRGWLYGIGFFGSSVYWVYISIHTYGNTSVFLATLITGVFIAFLAIFPGLNGWLLNRYFKTEHSYKYIFAYPAVWVILEWLRSNLFTGFPWVLLGTSQVSSPLKGYAPVIGVYGVSFLVIMNAGLLLDLYFQYQHKNYKKILQQSFFIVLIWLIGFGLTYLHWTTPNGKPVQVSLVQGNIPQDIHWSYEQLIPTLQRYQKLTDEHWDSKIIIWPENAIPVPLQNATDFIDFMSAEALKNKATIIAGIPVKHATKDAYYNAVIAFGNDGGFYLKHRLVPFGEYTPFADLLKTAMDHFQIPMSNMTVGEDAAKPIMAQGFKIATFICYEIAFPEQVLQNDGDIDMILTVSNDAWFGQSIALAQHVEMAQMRALEMGRPVLFVSNTGITAFITPNGKIQSAAPPDQIYVLTDKVQTVNGKTPWQRYGMDATWMMILISLFYAITAQRKK
jgi:apolipoprotein N-acyltransferase